MYSVFVIHRPESTLLILLELGGVGWERHQLSKGKKVIKYPYLCIYISKHEPETMKKPLKRLRNRSHKIHTSSTMVNNFKQTENKTNMRRTKPKTIIAVPNIHRKSIIII